MYDAKESVPGGGIKSTPYSTRRALRSINHLTKNIELALPVFLYMVLKFTIFGNQLRSLIGWNFTAFGSLL
jgi:hypothetical protein